MNAEVIGLYDLSSGGCVCVYSHTENQRGVDPKDEV